MSHIFYQMGIFLIPLVGEALMGNSEFPLSSSLLGCKSVLLDALLESSRVIGF